MVQWALMTLLDPSHSLASLIYIGYNGNPASALRVTRRRSVDRKKQTTERVVFQCYVFGSKNAGKSALLHSLLGRCASEPIIIVNVSEYMLLPYLYWHVRFNRFILFISIFLWSNNYLCQFHRPFSNNYTPTTAEQYAANVVELIGVSIEKTWLSFKYFWKIIFSSSHVLPQSSILDFK